MHLKLFFKIKSIKVCVMKNLCFILIILFVVSGCNLFIFDSGKALNPIDNPYGIVTITDATSDNENGIYNCQIENIGKVNIAKTIFKVEITIGKTSDDSKESVVRVEYQNIVLEELIYIGKICYHYGKIKLKNIEETEKKSETTVYEKIMSVKVLTDSIIFKK